MIEWLTALLVCHLIGEPAARTLQFPMPGPVVGLAFLCAFLRLRGSVSDSLRQSAAMLHGHLSLLFALIDRESSDAGESSWMKPEFFQLWVYLSAVPLFAQLPSLLPKSVTAPIAMGIAEQIGGNPALTAVYCVTTGIVGAVLSRYVFAVCGVRSAIARGYALGTAAHGIGTARAFQESEESAPSPGLRWAFTGCWRHWWCRSRSPRSGHFDRRGSGLIRPR